MALSQSSTRVPSPVQSPTFSSASPSASASFQFPFDKVPQPSSQLPFNKAPQPLNKAPQPFKFHPQLKSHQSTLSIASDVDAQLIFSHSSLPLLTLSQALQITPVLMLCSFLVACDSTIVSVLLADISSSFDSSQHASWLGTSYLLTVAIFTPLMPRISDLFGRKQTLLASLAIFTLGTAACGVSGSITQLAIARAVAGVGGGGMQTIGNVIMTDIVSTRDRGVLVGVSNILFCAGLAAGGAVGGIVADWSNWRVAFLGQVPLLIAAYFTVACRLPAHILPIPVKLITRDVIAKLDIAGACSLAVWISALIFGISFKGAMEMPWSDPKVYVSFATAVVGLAAFVFAESRATLPVMPLRLFRQRNPSLVFVASFLLSFMIFVNSYSMPLFLRTVQLRPAHEAGLVMLPSALWSAAASLLTGIYIRSSGKYYSINLISGILTLLTFSCLLSVDASSSAYTIIACLIGFGMSTSGSFTANFIATVASISTADNAVTIGVIYLFRMLGQVLGVSLSSALLQFSLVKQLEKVIQGPGAAELIDSIRHRADAVGTLEPILRAKVITSYDIAFNTVFKATTLAAIIGLLLCIPLKVYDLNNPGIISLGDEEQDGGSGSDTETEM